MSAQQLTIDHEFQSLCPELTPEERNLLEASLDAEGCRDPILTWANHSDTIVDGHNRYEYCSRFKISFKTKALTFESREEVISWIIANQLGRRNLSEEQKAFLRGKRYKAEKAAATNPDGVNQHSEVGGKTYHQPKTAEKLAKEYSVSEKTIRNDAKFADRKSNSQPASLKLEDLGITHSQSARYQQEAAEPKRQLAVLSGNLDKILPDPQTSAG